MLRTKNRLSVHPVSNLEMSLVSNQDITNLNTKGAILVLEIS